MNGDVDPKISKVEHVDPKSLRRIRSISGCMVRRSCRTTSSRVSETGASASRFA